MYIKYLLDEAIVANVIEKIDSLNILLIPKNNEVMKVGFEFFNNDPFYQCTIVSVDSCRIIALVDSLFVNSVKIGDSLSTELPFEIPGFLK